MPQQFVSGHNNYCLFGTVQVHVASSSWDESALLADVTNTGTVAQFGTNPGTLAVNAVVPTKLDGKGTVKMYLDLLAAPYDSGVNIVAGASGQWTFLVGGLTQAFLIPITIEHVHYESQVAGTVEWSCDVVLNYLAPGVFARPA